MRAVSLIASLAVLAACGDDASTTSDAPATVDAAVDAAGGLPTTCTGACVTTALTANFGATVRVLDRAYYGVNLDGTLHVEAYRGGGSGCPTMTSPTPAYTLVLGGVPVPTSTAAATSPGNVLDYTGDLLGGPLGAAATAVTLTPVAFHASDLLAFDATLTFAGGSIAGHADATHCASLDE